MMRSNGSFRSTLATGMALVALAAACASSQSASERHGTIIDASRTVTHTTDNGVKVSLDAPRDSAWKALLGAYGDIGLLPDVADASTGAVGATRSRCAASTAGCAPRCCSPAGRPRPA
jgi:hypothetical protein